jgi:hypothetical protein
LDFCNFHSFKRFSNVIFEKNIQINEYNYSRNYRCWSHVPDFVLSNKVLKQWSIQMTSGLQLEQELKKEELKDEDGTSYLAIKAAQDLLKAMLIL